jgi:hypothetical protein
VDFLLEFISFPSLANMLKERNEFFSFHSVDVIHGLMSPPSHAASKLNQN